MSEPAESPFGLPPYAVERLQRVFAAWPHIDRVVLYGSRAKGNYRKASDIDLCIEGEGLGITGLLRIESEIDDLLLPWKVDLSLRQTVEDPALLNHIDRVGLPFYERQPK